MEINELEPRAKKRRQLGLSAPTPSGSSSTQGPAKEVRGLREPGVEEGGPQAPGDTYVNVRGAADVLGSR